MITSLNPGQRLIVNQTDSVTFECSATGIPTPLIQWYQGDLLLNGTGPGINSRVNLITTETAPLGELSTAISSLTISDTMGGDSGNYTCAATNVLTNYTEMSEERKVVIIELFVQGKHVFKVLSMHVLTSR